MVYDKKVQILGIQQISDTVYQWTSEKAAFAYYERQSKTNIFSKIGIGATSATFILPPTGIGLHHAISYGGRHYFLTAIDRKSVIEMILTAAEVEPQTCTATRWVTTKNQLKNPVSVSREIATFPAVIIEKYQAHTQGEPMARTDTTLVMVTPKPISLISGDLIETGGGVFAVTVCHNLDPYKNEYEIRRKEDA